MSNASQMLTMSLVKTLLGLEPIRNADPAFAAVRAKWDQIQAKNREKRGCCGRTSFTMNLVREFGQAVYNAPPAAKKVVLDVIGTQALFCHIIVDGHLRKTEIAAA